ncbi:MAG: transposase [Gemmataceae bacterium]|nr:transposase [Gemmataceae bacterium]
MAAEVDGHHQAVRVPTGIRKAIYATNAIESVNSVIRKFTRYRKQHPNGESAFKIVLLAIQEASRR